MGLKSMTSKTISLGGKLYDSETGLPIAESSEIKIQSSQRSPQSSSTLNRQYVSKPNLKIERTMDVKFASNPRVRQIQRRERSVAGQVVSQRSPAITRFSPGQINKTTEPIIVSQTQNADVQITSRQNSELIKRLELARRQNRYSSDLIKQVARERAQRQLKLTAQAERLAMTATKKDPVATPIAKIEPDLNRLAEIKNQAILEALVNAPSSDELEATAPKLPLKFRFKRLMSVAAGSLAVVILGGYLTYINMPNIMLKVAASQAGIIGSYPQYKPLGYSLEKPAKFDNNRVSMKFVNNHKDAYSIHQQKTSWNSETLLEKIVKEEAGENYTTDQENGLTVYIFGEEQKKASWINGGVLYQIEASAELTNDQIRSIAVSL